MSIPPIHDPKWLDYINSCFAKMEANPEACKVLDIATLRYHAIRRLGLDADVIEGQALMADLSGYGGSPGDDEMRIDGDVAKQFEQITGIPLFPGVFWLYGYNVFPFGTAIEQDIGNKRFCVAYDIARIYQEARIEKKRGILSRVFSTRSNREDVVIAVKPNGIPIFTSKPAKNGERGVISFVMAPVTAIPSITQPQKLTGM